MSNSLPFQPLIRQTNIKVRDLTAPIPLTDYLARRFNYLTTPQWLEQINAGHLTINAVTAQPATLLKPDDTLHFSTRHLDEPTVCWQIDILARTDDYLLLNKPPALPCHPAGRFFNHTLWAWLKQCANVAEPHFVNRLDRETSGLVLVATNAPFARLAAKALSQPETAKEYLVVVHGLFPENLTAAGYIGTRSDAKIRKKRYFMTEPQNLLRPEACRTAFRCRAQTTANGGLSLLSAVLDSGRTHQIRATLASIGFPLLGDKLYGLDEQLFLKRMEQQLDDDDQALLQLDHQALHAWRLRLASQNPLGCQQLFCAPPPDDFCRLLKQHALTIPDLTN